MVTITVCSQATNASTTKLEVTTTIAISVPHAKLVTHQTSQELNVSTMLQSSKDHNVVAHRLSKTISVFLAQEVNSLTTLEPLVCNKTITRTSASTIRSEEHGKTATHAQAAKMDTNQTSQEHSASTLLQSSKDHNAVAHRLSKTISVLLAQEVNSLTTLEPLVCNKTITRTSASTIKSEEPGKTATNALAAKMDTNQTNQELSVFTLPQLLLGHNALALRLLTKTISANLAQEVNLLTKGTPNVLYITITITSVTDSTKSKAPGKTATNAQHAKTDSHQVRIDLLALDQDQLAIASRDMLQMDSLANNAKTDTLLTQETTNNVFQLQLVLVTTNTEESVMLSTATNAEHANKVSKLLKIDQDV